jgi:hypothetical protein
MSTEVFVAIMALLAVYFVRNNMTLKYRLRAIDLDLNVFRDGPSYEWMLFDLRKWTFKQFYPELCA